MNAHSLTVKLFAAYPGPVKMSGYELGSRLARNSSLTLSCTSCGGHPTPNITWTRGGGQELYGQAMTSGDPQNGCVIGVLNLADLRDSVYKVEFGCVASNAPIDERNIISKKSFQYSAAHRWKAETLSFLMVYALN